MDEAIALVCAKNFHQCLWLPASALHERLRVTYSTTRNFADTSLPAVLFSTPMFGTRLMVIDADELAREIGVRVVIVDRPGMGGSTPVTLDLRVKIWLETVPVLLMKLGVQHVSLVTHSAGTLYVLNTLYELPTFLDPRKPYIALMAPWVDHTHSNATLMNLASHVPNGWLGSFNKVQKFIGSNLMFSGGVVSDVAELFHPASDGGEAGDDGENYGVSADVAAHVTRLRMAYTWAEDTTAGNEEARLCLKKLGAGNWGACEDYEQYVRDLTEQRNAAAGAPLKFRVFFAESDMMIGKGGQAYFEKCWSQPGIQGVVDYKSEELPGTSHETILDLKSGALRKIFEEIKSLREE